MKIPQAPRPMHSIFRNLESDQLRAVIGQSPTHQGRYFHWDELRHRTPPEGLNHEMWWAGMKLARVGMQKALSLLDKNNRSIQFTVPDKILLALHEIDRQAAGEIAMPGEVVSGEDRNRYLVNSLIEEAITSSQLEGAATTRQEASKLLRSGREPRDRSERMIVNNYRVMERIRTLKDEPFEPNVVLELHRIVTEGTLDERDAAGRFRRSDERIYVLDKAQANVLHEPPDASELPQRLRMLCEFANRKDSAKPFVHPVIKAILIHFMLGYDHPFVDGNGRTARALFYWSMARSGYWLIEYLSISRLIKKAPSQYARAFLYTETDDNDATYFVIHQLDLICRAIEELHDYLARKMREQHTAEQLLYRSALFADSLNHRQIALLGHALRHAGHGYTVESHKRSHRVTTQTSRTDLLALEELGLLDKRKRGRAFVFYAPQDLTNRIEAASG